MCTRLQPAPWPWWFAGLGVAIYVLVQLLVGALGAALAQGAGVTDAERALAAQGHWMLSAQLVLFMVLAVAVPAALARPLRAAHLGLGTVRLRCAGLMIVAGAVLFTALAALYAALVPDARFGSTELVRDLDLRASRLRDAVAVLNITLLAPVGEEMLFRALIFRALRDGLARWLPRGVALGAAVLVSTLLFTQAHSAGGLDLQLPMLFVLGALLALSYELTGSLAVPIMIHSLNNTIGVMQGFHAAGPGVVGMGWYALAAAGPLLALAMIWLTRRILVARVAAGAA